MTLHHANQKYDNPIEVAKPYLSYLVMFVGMGLISGSIVHAGQEGIFNRSSILFGVGVILFSIGSFINEVLFEYEFKRVDFITEPGEFSVRGGIVDVFSFSNDNPYRIEFFGNEVESIRSFDVGTQLSLEKQKKITIIPNVENKVFQENRESFLDYIAERTVLFLQNTEQQLMVY